MLSSLKKHTILYVEDELPIQANIAEYLASYFGEVYLASNGEEAITNYDEYCPDVLLLDINLPGMDGLSLAKKIRHRDLDVKIVMLTAFTETEKLLKATELKLTKYLVKPVAPKMFKEVLHLLASELASNPSRFVNLGNSSIWDKQTEQLSVDGVDISLTEKEYRLLKLFICEKGKPVRYEKIVSQIWGDTFDREISIDSIKNQISQLRKKIPGVSVSNIYGEGYILK